MLRPDDLAPPLPGYCRVIVCSPAAERAVRAKVDELGPAVAALVHVQPRPGLWVGEGYTWQRPLDPAVTS